MSLKFSANNPSLGSKPASAFRILLVEDNNENRELLSQYLSYVGYQVLNLADGSTFFQALEQFQPHLVLLDLKLPGMDGYAILQQLQQRQDYWHIPVIVVSAFAFQADRQKAMSLGACRYLVKPVSPMHLCRAIYEELNK